MVDVEVHIFFLLENLKQLCLQDFLVPLYFFLSIYECIHSIKYVSTMFSRQEKCLEGIIREMELTSYKRGPFSKLSFPPTFYLDIDS